ncbi:MAG: DUF308 domain-containing protein [Oscillospiraceae bacterium]
MRQRSSYGWLELVIGILLSVLGIYSFFRPVDYLTTLIVIYGIAALVTGIADIVFYCKMERHIGFAPTISLATGVLGVMAGLVLMVHPGAGRWAIGLFFPLWFIAHCISRLTHLSVVRLIAGTTFYVFDMIINILGIILGVLMLLTPQVTLLSMNLVIGFYLLLLGIDCIIEACTKLGAQDNFSPKWVSPESASRACGTRTDNVSLRLREALFYSLSGQNAEVLQQNHKADAN